jgi:hypothetical protein
MMCIRNQRTILLSAMALCLAACGGGGGGGSGINSTPPPTPTPTPAPAPAGANVVIFPSPTPQTYASVGVNSHFSTVDSDQAHIRYNPGGYYEIQMPGAAWDRLITAKGVIPQDPQTNNNFQPASAGQNEAHFITYLARLSGYQYSEMAGWSDLGNSGLIAFGSATPAGAAPMAGSATYNGIVSGSSDILQFDGLAGQYIDTAIGGSVQLAFNFGAGTLAGSMTLRTDPYVGPVNLGTFAFKDTVFSAGGVTYSGAFDTAAAGRNFFLGRFTGPNAEETIGAWALPFLFSGDGATHQAQGVWIAKK